MTSITLRGNVINIAAEKAKTPSDPVPTDYILVECKAALSAKDTTDLVSAQVFIEEYVGNETYLCRYPPRRLAALANVSCIKTAVPYPVQAKISPDLRTAAAQSTQNLTIAVHIQDGVQGGVATLLLLISSFTKPVIVNQTDEFLTATVDPKSVDKIAALDVVRSIGLDYQPVTDSGQARQIMLLNNIILPPPQLGAVNYPAGLDGTGQIITVADTGFDIGDTHDVHPAFKGRVLSVEAVGATDNSKGDDPEGHGTHVAGCALGNGTVLTKDVPQQTFVNQGAAPGAQLRMQALGIRDSGKLARCSRAMLVRDATEHGSFIHNNSYGNPEEKEYDQHAWEFDNEAYRSPQVVICCSAGNGGREGKHIGGQGGAKNVVTVGACLNSRTIKIANDFFDPNAPEANPNNMADFSNVGPVLNGENRVKPDIVAPGVAILSAASRDLAFANGFTKDRKKNPTQTRLIDQMGPSPDGFFWWFASGTSMATPLVSGFVAVLRQAAIYYLGNPTPNATLIKALLVHGGQDIGTGLYQGKPIGPAPNYIQGHGRADVAASLAPVFGQYTQYGGGVWEDQLQQVLVPVTRDITVPAPAGGAAGPAFNTITATLVYADLPGENLQSLINFQIQQLQQTTSPYVKSMVGDNVLRITMSGLAPNDTCRLKVDSVRLCGGRTLSQPFSIVWSFSHV